MTIRIECLSKLAYIFVCSVLSCINFCPLCEEIEYNLSYFCRIFPSFSSPSLCCVAGIVVVFQIKRIHFSHKVLRCPWVIIAGSAAPLLSENTVVCTVFFSQDEPPCTACAQPSPLPSLRR
jgi:hypothetical protein